MKDTEIIKARSYDEAVAALYDLYPTLTDFTLLSRRDASGRFSRQGHTFLFQIEFEAPEEPAPGDLGEEEY